MSRPAIWGIQRRERSTPPFFPHASSLKNSLGRCRAGVFGCLVFGVWGCRVGGLEGWRVGGL